MEKTTWGGLMPHPDVQLPAKLTGPSGFKNFLWSAWKAIQLPPPTPVQYDIADWMSHGPDRQVTMAFRGIGKSYIASAFVVYCLLLNPHLIIQVVSGSKQRADDFSTFTLQLLHALGPLTQHLIPRDDQRNSKIAFDVGPARASHAPSVTSKGIFSQITGTRADIIIADDVVTSQNSLTQVMRDKIIVAVGEFNAILKPGGRIMYLGTPQSEEDLLHHLPEKGFTTRIWPAEIPSAKVVRSQGEKLAPMIRELIEAGVPQGTPTDPLRFDAEDLEERRMGYGRTGYAMQFLLDQSLADAERYPLKLPEMMVTDLDPETCFEKYVWCNEPEKRIADKDMPDCVGFSGEYYYRPLITEGGRVPYTGTVMAIDPSGRGSDETGYSIVSTYGGQFFVKASGGLQGGYDPGVLQELACLAKEHRANYILIEENFGGGMFANLLTPVLIKNGYAPTIEEVRHSIQKEKRICDVLEPIMNSHKLIVDRRVLQDDWLTIQRYSDEVKKHYSLAYQLSRITREKGALRHDDRLDALAMAVQYWVEAAAQDTEKQMEKQRLKRIDEEIRKFHELHAKRTRTKVPDRGGWIPKW